MSVHTRQRRRAVLIAPASDQRKVSKALDSDADEVVLDLEDAVVPAAKAEARTVIRRAVSALPSNRTVSIRINALTTQWATEDLNLCVALGERVSSIVLPKAETAEQISEVSAQLAETDIGVQALIETPLGTANVRSIAIANPRVESLVLGYADLGAALGRSAEAGPESWLTHQDAVLTAARIAGIHAIDGPWLAVTDTPAFRRWIRWVDDLGFDGKWVIHPSQIDTVTTVFTPSAAALVHAQRVLRALQRAESDGAGAVQLDGKMLDEAVAVAARRILARQ